jgi:hypothetical protein
MNRVHIEDSRAYTLLVHYQYHDENIFPIAQTSEGPRWHVSKTVVFMIPKWLTNINKPEISVDPQFSQPAS